MLIRIETHPNGRRLHVVRWRWHHAHTGLALIAAGVWLVIRDLADFPWSFKEAV